jgi:hypothetical protein
MNKLNYKTLEELKVIKTALQTLIAYDLHQDVLLKTDELVIKLIENKKEEIWCDCGCNK